jgi:transposase
MAQITVISGMERPQRWINDQKLAMGEAAMAPGAAMSSVARNADVSSWLIYKWRRELIGEAGKLT